MFETVFHRTFSQYFIACLVTFQAKMEILRQKLGFRSELTLGTNPNQNNTYRICQQKPNLIAKRSL